MSLLDPPTPMGNGKPDFKCWHDYAAPEKDRISPHLFETGDDLGPVEDFRVPAGNYLAREQHEREREHLWGTVWQMACRLNDIPNVGDYLEYEIGDRSLIIVRDSETSVKALKNACRHRATAMISGKGNTSCFTCPFHGWAYKLDGSLEHVPAGWDFPQFDGSGLREVRCETYNSNVYVNLDDNAAPLIDHIGATMHRNFEAYPDHRMWKSWHFGIVVESNWKIMAEAFFEAYHVPWTHPAYAPGSGDVQGRIDVFRFHHRLISMALIPSFTSGWESTEQEIFDCVMQAAGGFVQIPDGQDPDSLPQMTLPDGVTARRFMADTIRGNWGGQGLDLSGVSETELVDLFSNLIFPNFVSFVGPGGHVTYRFRPNGDDHNSMIFDIANLVPVPGDGPLPPDVPMTMIPRGTLMRDHELAQKVLGQTTLIVDEDVSNSARIQKGLKVSEEIVVGEELEPNIVAFHRNIERWMTGDRRQSR